MSDKTVVVIGGGFGGLSSAALLQKKGYNVKLVEKNERVGGVANVIEVDGFRFDTGPSWYLMPEVFEKFFSRFDKKPKDYYNLKELDPQFSVHWKDGDSIRVPSDDKSVRKIFESYEEGSGDMLKDYMSSSEEAYELGMERFIYPNRNSLRDFVDLDVIRSSKAVGLFTDSLGEHVSTYFTNEKLRQTLLFNIVFLGGTPDTTPAFYKLMSYATMKGVYYPEGGIYELVKAMRDVALEQGVNINTGTPVENVKKENGEYAVECEDEIYRGDIVVSNADYQYTEQEILSEDLRKNSSSHWDSIEYAPSALLLYLGIEGEIDNIEHHSLVFPIEWDEHFKSIEDSSKLPDNPAYYLNVPSKTDNSVSPNGCETLVALVPIGSGMDISEDRMSEFRDLVIRDIENTTETRIEERIKVERRMCLDDFTERYNKSEGTALGISHTLRQTSILRPSMRYKDNLYFAGGDTRPGIGVPMATISGMHVSDLIQESEN
jgi:phytoene desaturase